MMATHSREIGMGALEARQILVSLCWSDTTIL